MCKEIVNEEWTKWMYMQYAVSNKQNYWKKAEENKNNYYYYLVEKHLVHGIAMFTTCKIITELKFRFFLWAS